MSSQELALKIVEIISKMDGVDYESLPEISRKIFNFVSDPCKE